MLDPYLTGHRVGVEHARPGPEQMANLHRRVNPPMASLLQQASGARAQSPLKRACRQDCRRYHQPETKRPISRRPDPTCRLEG